MANVEEEAWINTTMGSGPYHRIRQVAIYRIEKLLQDFRERVVYSVRDETETLKDRETWSASHEEAFRECFEPPRDSLRSGDYLGIRSVDNELRVVYQFIIDLSDDAHRRFLRFRGHRGINWFLDIISDDYSECEAMWEMVRGNYYIAAELPSARRHKPKVSFLQSDHGKLRLTPMRMADDRRMSGSDLVLHYGGQEILDYERKLLASLEADTAGLHLLHGKPGVGKTSLLLHLISVIKSRHQLIYLPTQYFENISSPESFSFWAELAENREEGKRTVLLVEDAEALIQARDTVRGYQASLVSNLLNVTDGILGQALGLHVMATFNTEVDKIDPALLRSGRLKTFREFKLLPADKAGDLARHLGRELEVERDEYTLAEIYCGKAVRDQDEDRPIGFGDPELAKG
jgi:energy-coupling factor transporter ATP-binding protein EcfA2